MNKFVFYVFLFLALLAPSLNGCAYKDAPPKEKFEEKGKKFEELASSKAMRVTDAPYLGAKSIELRSQSAPVLQTRVTMRSRGSLHQVVDVLRGLVPVTMNLAEESDSETKTGAKSSHGSSPLPPATSVASRPGEDPDKDPLEALLASSPVQGAMASGVVRGKPLNINYDGPLLGLLSQISIQSGYGWDYDRTNNTITFARMMVRTFTLFAAPGEVSFENQLTNKSKETNAASGSMGGSNVNSTVSAQDTSTQTNQTAKTKLKFDIWKDTEAVVKTMLSTAGKVVANQASGTLTVRDRPENIRRIGAFIDYVNDRYARQVSLRVNVWSLEITDASEAGIDLQAMFRNDDLSIVAGSLSAAVGSLDTAAATVVSGKLRDSTAILKAFRRWGNATQVTSGGAVAMNNQPAPILNTTRYSYLAGSSTQTTDYGSTIELTPGEITTGFTMVVVPHILENRRVVLQYTVNLSSLDNMQTISTAGTEIQLPQVSTRAFSQRVTMQMGQTLVLAGFAQSTLSNDKKAGLLSFGKGAEYRRTLLVITIEVENASPELGLEG
jgi:type IVB pilus formation R64 PilN family outer membrane protein